MKWASEAGASAGVRDRQLWVGARVTPKTRGRLRLAAKRTLAWALAFHSAIRNPKSAMPFLVPSPCSENRHVSDHGLYDRQGVPHRLGLATASHFHGLRVPQSGMSDWSPLPPLPLAIVRRNSALYVSRISEM